MELSWKRLLANKILSGIAFVTVVLMILAAYSNTLYSPPVLDDFHSFIDEPLTKVQTWSMESIITLGQTKFGFFRWIPMTTFAWDIWFGKGELIYLHATNITIHIICFVLAFLFVFYVGKTQKILAPDDSVPFRSIETALWVSAIWALNPVQTNAVTYLVQRMTSLGALFYLLSMTCYLAGRIRVCENRGGKTGARILYGLAFVAAGLAFLSKENAATLPVLIVLTEWWFFQPELLRHVLDFCKRHKLVTAVVCGAVLVIGYRVLVAQLAGFGGRHFTAGQRLLTEARIVVWYVSVLLWPHPGRLSLEHHVELSTSLFHPFSTIISIVCLGIAGWWTITRRRTYPLVTYGLMFFFLNLVIESSIIPLELVFEHRMYLPSVGLFLAVVATAQYLLMAGAKKLTLREVRTVSYCAVGILVSILTLGTFERNETWRDHVTLGADDVAKQPDSPRAHSNYAVALSRANRNEEAIAEARAAMRLGQRHYEEYGVSANTILLGYRAKKEHEKVVDEGRQFVAAWPEDADPSALPGVWLSISAAEAELGELKGSHESILTAAMTNFRMRPQIPDFEYVCAKQLENLFKASKEKGIDLPGVAEAEAQGLGGTYWVARQLLDVGYVAAGERYLKMAASVDEHHAKICQRMLEDMQDERVQNIVQKSKWSFEKKYVERPFSRFNICMAVAYLVRDHKLPSCFAKLGELSLDYALKLDPDSSDAHLLKGWYYFEKDQIDEALLAAHKALALDPDYAKAWMGLGFFLAQRSDPGEAVSAFTKALDLYPGYPQRNAIIGIINSLQQDA